MKTIDERELQNTLPAPADGWYAIEACGDYPNTAWVEERQAEVPFVQHITPDVLAAVAEAGVPPEGLPIDKDHLSLSPENDTAAMGWVRELAVCGEQLCARIEWTPLGLPLVQGRCYKHFSTVYPPCVSQYTAGHYKPERLAGLALTNQPNNRGSRPPITNCRRDESLFCPHGGGEKHNNTNTTEDMEYPAELLAALGLAEGATEEEVIAAAKEQAGKAAAAAEAEAAAAKAEEEAQQAKDDAVAAEADAMISTETAEAGVELTDEEKDELRGEFATNRAKGKRMLQLMIAAKGGSVLNRRRYPTKTPAAPATGRRMTELEKAAATCNRAKAICAERRARGEKPNFWEVLRGVRIEDSIAN